MLFSGSVSPQFNKFLILLGVTLLEISRSTVPRITIRAVSAERVEGFSGTFGVLIEDPLPLSNV